MRLFLSVRTSRTRHGQVIDQSVTGVAAIQIYLNMNGFAVGSGGGLGQGFAHRGVGVNGLVNFIHRGLQLHAQPVFGNQLGGIGTDDVSA